MLALYLEWLQNKKEGSDAYYLLFRLTKVLKAIFLILPQSGRAIGVDSWMIIIITIIEGNDGAVVAQ